MLKVIKLLFYFCIRDTVTYLQFLRLMIALIYVLSKVKKIFLLYIYESIYDSSDYKNANCPEMAK